MKKCSRYRKARLFHITVWGLIVFLSIRLIIQCIQIFGAELNTDSRTPVENKLISSLCNYMMQSNIPIADYVINDGKDNKQNNFILNAMAGISPINRYVAENADSNHYIEEDHDSGVLANGDLKFSDEVYMAILNENKKKLLDDLNGTNEDSDMDSEAAMTNPQNLMPIDIINGDVYLEQGDTGNLILNESNNTKNKINAKETLGKINGQYFTLENLLNRSFLYNNFYITDGSTKVDDKMFDAKKLLGKDMTIKQKSEKPQILIYHTHSRETFIDSREGVEDDTIVGLGAYLTKVLTEKYGYNVIHDKTHYDIVDGKLDRNLAYNCAKPGIEKILEYNPSIEVVIDLHRDGVNSDAKRVSTINGKEVAQLMFFNGLSANSKGEKISYLDNPYTQDNLAFSLQLQLAGRELYPGLMYKNYLKAYRYNMHLRPKSLLVETGTQNNTLGEAKNAMDLLADILDQVLTGKQ
ncbi:MAG: stage II sporulation protein P [Anaerocolumna aminovalerica]|uniref:stage II sporulation protein P n=1 Tax=Anaerocolumna aminovalerica TaxID=1527 RepID=UPI0015967C56|nr:stage II sporulation protein P [Anaerocolumna aminovalerica]MDU6264361.1 stage II sporulation protein P [Anaerocolumna aminovalerica]